MEHDITANFKSRLMQFLSSGHCDLSTLSKEKIAGKFVWSIGWPESAAVAGQFPRIYELANESALISRPPSHAP